MSSHSHLVTGDGPFTTDQLLVDAERTARQLLTQPHSVHGTTLLPVGTSSWPRRPKS